MKELLEKAWRKGKIQIKEMIKSQNHKNIRRVFSGGIKPRSQLICIEVHNQKYICS